MGADLRRRRRFQQTSMAANRPGAGSVEPNSGAPDSFRPIRLLDIEIGQPLEAVVPGVDGQGRPYEKALALVRFHGRPIATAPLDLPPTGLDAAELAARLRDGLASAERTALLDEAIARLGETGPRADGSAARVVAERDAFLARAPFASVVIATRNRPDSLARCLDSLATLIYPAFEVIVVDNAPSDDATERFFAGRYADSDRIRYVREDRPGLASAHNRGVREISPRSRFVAFTDDDVVVDPYWLCELMRGFEAEANVGCVTGLIFPAELETWPQLLIEQFGGFNKGFRRQIFDQGRHRPDDRLFPFTPGRFGSGANMAFRTEALEKIGGFDPAIGAGTPALGGDDLAAFFQIVRAGYALVYEPAAIVRHTHYRDYAALQRQIHGYGVGLTAFLTKALLDEPRLLPLLARKLPGGLSYALSARSGKNRKKGLDYPPELTALERKGMLHGPVAYLRSRAAARRLQREARP